MLMFTIAWKELRSTFGTTVGWLVLAAFLLISGLFWSSMVVQYVEQSNNFVDNPYAAQQIKLTDYLLSPYFGNMAVILLMIVPALSMRLFSEELKSRTMELLFTSPVTTLEIVLGKFLGTMGFIAVMLACTVYVPATVWFYGTPDWGTLFTGYLAVWLVCSTVVSIGMLFSSMTPNALVAVIASFAASLSLWLLSWWADGPDSFAVKVSIAGHMEDLLRGAISLTDIAYFASLIAFFLFATHQRIDAYRWR